MLHLGHCWGEQTSVLSLRKLQETNGSDESQGPLWLLWRTAVEASASQHAGSYVQRELKVRTMFRGALAQPPLEVGSLIYFSVIPPLLLHPPQSLQGQGRRGWGKLMAEPSGVLSGSWILPHTLMPESWCLQRQEN